MKTAKKKPAIKNNPGVIPLEDRLEALQAEIDAVIAELVDARTAACPGVPRGIVENIVIGKAGGCKCEALKLVRKAQGS
jgi:hypothetical protein